MQEYHTYEGIYTVEYRIPKDLVKDMFIVHVAGEYAIVTCNSGEPMIDGLLKPPYRAFGGRFVLNPHFLYVTGTAVKPTDQCLWYNGDRVERDIYLQFIRNDLTFDEQKPLDDAFRAAGMKDWLM